MWKTSLTNMTRLSFILFVGLCVVALTSIFILALPLHFKKQDNDWDDFTPAKLPSEFSRRDVSKDGVVKFQELVAVTPENIADSFKAAVHSIHHGETKPSLTEFEDSALNLDIGETDVTDLKDSVLHTRNEINVSVERDYGHQNERREAGEPSEVIDIDNENDDVIHTTDDTDYLDMRV